MFKKLIFLALLFLLVPAGSMASDIDIYIDNEYINIDDSEVSIDDQGRVQVPIRIISETLGANVDWHGSERLVEIERYDTRLELTVGSRAYRKNGERIYMDTFPRMASTNRTVVPLRVVSEGLGKNVEWNASENRVDIAGERSVAQEKPENEVDKPREQKEDSRNDLEQESDNDKKSSKISMEDEYNTRSLIYDVDFQFELDDDVYWVPVNSLGKTNYTLDEMKESKGDYEWVKNNINTVYEFIQYIQATDFWYESSNNETALFLEDQDNWRIYAPGEYVIDRNKGDCTGLTSAFIYALEGKYDEIGTIYQSYLERGEYIIGHVFPYIKENGYYYVIDPLMHMNQYRRGVKTEFIDGEKFLTKSRYENNHPRFIMHKSDSLEKIANQMNTAKVEQDRRKIGAYIKVESTEGRMTPMRNRNRNNDGIYEVTRFYPSNYNNKVEVLLDWSDRHNDFDFSLERGTDIDITIDDIESNLSGDYKDWKPYILEKWN